MSSENEFAEIGRRVRTIRKSRGLSLEQLAKKTGFSPSYISQIENAKRSLHLRVLREMARALDVALVDFLQEDQGQEVALVRVADRRTYTLATGAIESLLLTRGRGSLEVTIMELPPGRTSGEPNTHAGEEMSFVLDGSVQVTIGNSTHQLDQGDIIYYRSTHRHCWSNPFTGPARVLITNTPATF